MTAIEIWYKSIAIIKTMLIELRPDMPNDEHEHNAKAIIARLAKEDLSIEENKP